MELSQRIIKNNGGEETFFNKSNNENYNENNNKENMMNNDIYENDDCHTNDRKSCENSLQNNGRKEAEKEVEKDLWSFEYHENEKNCGNENENRNFKLTTFSSSKLYSRTER